MRRENDVALRRATMEDAALLLAWRNQPATRANSIDATEISEDAHAAWLRRTLQDPHRYLFIAVIAPEQTPIGSGRLDVKAGIGEISLTVAAEYRGQGFGAAIINALVDVAAAAGVGTVRASVKGHNLPSLRAFLSEGFRLEGQIAKLSRKIG